MLFGRRKPGYTTTVDGSVDPEQAVLELQKAELAAKKKPKAEVFDINAASETARRLKETGSSFDGSAAKTGEDVIAAVERETAELAAMQAAGAAPEAAETVQDEAAKPQLLDFLAGEPEAENDPFADRPTHCWSVRWRTPTSCWLRCRRPPSARISLSVQAQRIPTITPTPT